MRKTQPDLMTTSDAAAVLGVTPTRVRQLIAARLLPAQRYGRDWLLPREAVEARRKARAAEGEGGVSGQPVVIRDRAGRVLGQLHETGIGWHVMTFLGGRVQVSIADSREHAEQAIRAAHAGGERSRT